MPAPHIDDVKRTAASTNAIVKRSVRNRIFSRVDFVVYLAMAERAAELAMLAQAVEVGPDGGLVLMVGGPR